MPLSSATLRAPFARSTPVTECAEPSDRMQREPAIGSAIAGTLRADRKRRPSLCCAQPLRVRPFHSAEFRTRATLELRVCWRESLLRPAEWKWWDFCPISLRPCFWSGLLLWLWGPLLPDAVDEQIDRSDCVATESAFAFRNTFVHLIDCWVVFDNVLFELLANLCNAFFSNARQLFHFNGAMCLVVCAAVVGELAVRAKGAIAIEAEEHFLILLVVWRVAHTYRRANIDFRVSPRSFGHLDMEFEYSGIVLPLLN